MSAANRRRKRVARGLPVTTEQRKLLKKLGDEEKYRSEIRRQLRDSMERSRQFWITWVPADIRNVARDAVLANQRRKAIELLLEVPDMTMARAANMTDDAYKMALENPDPWFFTRSRPIARPYYPDVFAWWTDPGMPGYT